MDHPTKRARCFFCHRVALTQQWKYHTPAKGERVIDVCAKCKKVELDGCRFVMVKNGQGAVK